MDDTQGVFCIENHAPGGHPLVVPGAGPITRGYRHWDHFGADRGNDYLYRFALDPEYALMVHGRPPG